MSINARTPVGPEDRLAHELKSITDRLDSLEAPSGTSTYQTVSKLRALVEDIQSQLDAYMAGRYTNAQIDALIDAKVSAAIAAVLAGTVTIGGGLTVGGTVTLPGARATSLSSASGRVASWIAGDGRLGYA